MIAAISGSQSSHYLNYGPRISPVKALLSFCFLILSLPFLTRATAHVNLNDRNIDHFCGMLGARTRVQGLKPFHSYYRETIDAISCSYKAPESTKTHPIKNYKALVQNKDGNYVRSHEQYTVGELAEQGVYTFDFPLATKVERTIFCGEKPYSCNKFIRDSQEKPAELSMADWKGWGLPQVIQYMEEIAHAEEYGESTGLVITGDKEGIRLLNESYPNLPATIKVEV